MDKDQYVLTGGMMAFSNELTWTFVTMWADSLLQKTVMDSIEWESDET